MTFTFDTGMLIALERRKPRATEALRAIHRRGFVPVVPAAVYVELWRGRSDVREEILGLEYDWLGSDGDGLVAIFTTAGGSYAPADFLRDTDEHDRAIEIALSRPPSTAAVFAPKLEPGLQNTWLAMAERGFFGFDGDPNGGPYRKVAVPGRPVHIDELPPEAATVARRVVFPHLKFTGLEQITEEALGAARSSGHVPRGA